MVNIRVRPTKNLIPSFGNSGKKIKEDPPAIHAVIPKRSTLLSYQLAPAGQYLTGIFDDSISKFLLCHAPMLCEGLSNAR